MEPRKCGIQMDQTAVNAQDKNERPTLYQNLIIH
jgi:hypothetical protein